MSEHIRDFWWITFELSVFLDLDDPRYFTSPEFELFFSFRDYNRCWFDSRVHACLPVSTDMGCFVTWQGPRFKDEKGESPIDGLGRPGWILVDISTHGWYGQYPMQFFIQYVSTRSTSWYWAPQAPHVAVREGFRIGILLAIMASDLVNVREIVGSAVQQLSFFKFYRLNL